jgi:hypothetical protein
MSKHFVEVSIIRSDAPGTMITNRLPTSSLQESLKVAEAVAVRLFPEDLETLMTFSNGVYDYWNTNDMGDDVLIRPMIEVTPTFVFIDDLESSTV